MWEFSPHRGTSVSLSLATALPSLASIMDSDWQKQIDRVGEVYGKHPRCVRDRGLRNLRNALMSITTHRNCPGDAV